MLDVSPPWLSSVLDVSPPVALVEGDAVGVQAAKPTSMVKATRQASSFASLRVMFVFLLILMYEKGLGAYPFTEPIMMPLTKKRWKMG